MPGTGEIRKTGSPFSNDIRDIGDEKEKKSPKENTKTSEEIKDETKKENSQQAGVLKKKVDEEVKPSKDAEKTLQKSSTSTTAPETSRKSTDTPKPETSEKPKEKTPESEKPNNTQKPIDKNALPNQPVSETQGTKQKVDGVSADHPSASAPPSKDASSAQSSIASQNTPSPETPTKPAEPAKPTTETPKQEGPKSTPLETPKSSSQNGTPEANPSKPKTETPKTETLPTKDAPQTSSSGVPDSSPKPTETSKVPSSDSRQGSVESSESGKRRTREEIGRQFTETATRTAEKDPAFKKAYGDYQQAQKDFAAESNRYADTNSRWSGVLWNGITGGSADRSLQKSSERLDERREAMTRAADSVQGLTESDKRSLRNSTLSEDSSINQQNIAIANNLAESYGQQVGELRTLRNASGAVALGTAAVLTGGVALEGAALLGGSSTLGGALLAGGGTVAAAGTTLGLIGGAYELARGEVETLGTSRITGESLGDTANRLGPVIEERTMKSMDAGSKIGAGVGMAMATGNPLVLSTTLSALGAKGATDAMHNAGTAHQEATNLEQQSQEARSQGDTHEADKLHQQAELKKLERNLSVGDAAIAAGGTLLAARAMGKGPTTEPYIDMGDGGRRTPINDLRNVSQENPLAGRSMQAELDGSRIGGENVLERRSPGITPSGEKGPMLSSSSPSGSRTGTLRSPEASPPVSADQITPTSNKPTPAPSPREYRFDAERKTEYHLDGKIYQNPVPGSTKVMTGATRRPGGPTMFTELRVSPDKKSYTYIAKEEGGQGRSRVRVSNKTPSVVPESGDSRPLTFFDKRGYGLGGLEPEIVRKRGYDPKSGLNFEEISQTHGNHPGPSITSYAPKGEKPPLPPEQKQRALAIDPFYKKELDLRAAEERSWGQSSPSPSSSFKDSLTYRTSKLEERTAQQTPARPWESPSLAAEKLARQRLKSEGMSPSQVDASMKANTEQSRTQFLEDLATEKGIDLKGWSPSRKEEILRGLENERLSQLVEQEKPLHQAWEKLNTEARRREGFHTAERDGILNSPLLKNRNPNDAPTPEVAQKLHEVEIHNKAAQEARDTMQRYQMHQEDRHAYNIMKGRETAAQEQARIQERQGDLRAQEEAQRREMETRRQEGERLQQEREERARKRRDEILRAKQLIPEEERIPANE